MAWHLEGEGIRSVLVGGAVVAIYTEGLYRSGDLDMVPDDLGRKRLPEALAKIGFELTRSRYFKHRRCPHLFLEFPRGPVEIGGRLGIGDQSGELIDGGEEKRGLVAELAGVRQQADLGGAGDDPFLEDGLAGIGFRVLADGLIRHPQNRLDDRGMIHLSINKITKECQVDHRNLVDLTEEELSKSE